MAYKLRSDLSLMSTCLLRWLLLTAHSNMRITMTLNLSVSGLIVDTSTDNGHAL